MATELRALARTVASLAVALSSLAATPIYHASYDGTATLVSGIASCYETAVKNDDGDIAGFGHNSGCFVTIGSFVYETIPEIILPPGSIVRSAELRQWGYWEVDQFSTTVSVSPIDPTKPYDGDALSDSRLHTYAEADWSGFPSPDLLVYGSLYEGGASTR